MASFAAQLPAWCDRRGRPLSWRHYVYGAQYLARQRLRGQLTQAEAVRLAGAVQDEYVEWQDDMRRQTEAT